jgi:hypothetical protein
LAVAEVVVRLVAECMNVFLQVAVAEAVDYSVACRRVLALVVVALLCLEYSCSATLHIYLSYF